MEQRHSWEAKSSSASQEIPCILRNQSFITASTSVRHLSQSISQVPRLSVWTFRNQTFFYTEEVLAPPPNSKLEDQILSVVRDSFYNIFAATV